MGMIDPSRSLRQRRTRLDRLGELTGCAEFGDGRSCTYPATPDGPPRIIGRDDRGFEVWMRRWRCVAAHWYDLETPALDQDE